MAEEKKTRKPRARKPKEERIREMKTVGIRLPDDVYAYLKDEARKQNRSHSNLAAHIVIEWVRALPGGGTSQ